MLIDVKIDHFIGLVTEKLKNKDLTRFKSCDRMQKMNTADKKSPDFGWYEVFKV